MGEWRGWGRLGDLVVAGVPGRMRVPGMVGAVVVV